jgi:hypothetical protein
MKKVIGLIVVVLLLSACKKELGNMIYKAKFQTTNNYNKTTPKSNSDSLHTIFGDYITSITPYHLSSNVRMLVFQDYYTQIDPSCHMISYIENQTINVDFSGGAEIVFSPTLHSTDIRDGLFEQKEVDFKFISFTPELFNHGFQIPIQYLNAINDNYFLPGSTIQYDTSNNIINATGGGNLSYGAIHGNANAMPTGFMFAFGQTDSSYIYMNDGTILPENERFPFWDYMNTVIIRSNNFITQKVVMPDKGEEFTMYATLSFNTNNLIQVYAGNDNIPYTSDDVFVYAPHFWDRVRINLEMKYD